MRVLILRDDRPGHFNQSEGLVAALARRRPVVADRLRLLARPPFKGHLLRALAALRLPPAPLLGLAHGLRLGDLARPDLVVSAGADTLVANLLLARAWGCPNVFIGSLRGVSPTAFAAVLTIYPRLADGDRVILAAKPTTVDPDALPPRRPIDGPAGLAGARVSVLVGGPTPAHLWAADDWRRLAALLAELAGPGGASLVVTTSPRTPAAAIEALSSLRGRPGVEAVSLFGAADALPRDHFFAADAILVTGDSATMVFEAVSARRPVAILDPALRRPARDDAAFAWLAAEGRIARLALPEVSAPQLAAALAGVRPLAAHPMDLLIDRLAPALRRAGIDAGPTEP